MRKFLNVKFSHNCLRYLFQQFYFPIFSTFWSHEEKLIATHLKMFSVRGYHVHKDKWEASVGEELSCQRERGNLVDSFAISVVKDGDVVGNLPQKNSSICFTFLRNGMVTCQVTGSMRYSTNLPQGELEVPCILVFRWDVKRMDEARRILEFALASNKEDMNPS